MTAAYDPHAFHPFAVTVDIVVLSVSDVLEVLLVERGSDPFLGALALPGGFVLPEESLDVAAARELQEETGLGATELPGVHLEQLGSFGEVDRDPRMRVVSVAYLALTPTRPLPTAGSDAAGARWMPVDQALSAALAFDHHQIVEAGVERARSKLEYTTLAAALAGPEFTLGELQHIYEAMWGRGLERANFRRKVLATAGFVEATGDRRRGRGGGAPANTYRAAGAAVLTPPIGRGES